MELTITINGEPRTFELPDEVVRAAEALAERHHIAPEQAVAQAVVNQKLLEDEVDGGELIVKKGDRERHFQFA